MRPRTVQKDANASYARTSKAAGATRRVLDTNRCVDSCLIGWKDRKDGKGW